MAGRTPPSRAGLEHLAAPAAVSLAFIAVWLALPDKTFVFDGVMFAQAVERASEDWRADFFNPRHLLFNAAFQLLRDGLASSGLMVGAYRLFQIVNAIAGAAGLLLFADMVRRLTRDAALSVCAMAVLGATWCYGTRATEGQAYMLMSAGAVATLWACVRLLEAPSGPRAAAAAAAFAFAALFHSADAFLFPAVAAACWLAFPRRRALGAGAAAGALLLTAVPFLLSFSGSGLRGFFSSAADYHGAAGGFWSGLFAQFWGGASPLRRLVTACMETGMAFVPLSPAAGLVAGAALWAAAAAAVVSAWPRLDARQRGSAAVLAAGWAGFTAVNMFWPGGLFFYTPPHACLLALLALGASPRLLGGGRETRARVLIGLGAFAAALAAWNVRAGLLPQSRIENNPGYRTALWVGDHTVPSSMVVVTGFGFANSKVYLGTFAHRGREVLEYRFNHQSKEAALREVADFGRRQAASGVPTYELSDLAEPGTVEAEMRRRWGATFSEIESALGPARLVRVAASPDERVYLRVPHGRRAELFAGLGFSLLTEADRTRYAEHAVALAEVARGMTAAERRRAVALMKAKDWGFDLMVEGMGGYLGDASRDALAQRRERFAAFQKTAEFWKRVGNLDQILGLDDETVAAWTRAHDLSGDPTILAAVERLKARK